MKRVAIFSLYFWPEPTGIAPLATALADYLAEHGWDVTVVTGFPNRPGWQVYPPYRGKIFQRERRGSIRILRSWIYVPASSKHGSMKTWRRILHDCSLAASMFPLALFSRRPDVVVSITPPLQLAVAAIALKHVWRRPILNWIQDIVPDAALNVGMMREGPALRLARRMERFVYRNVERLGIISEGFRGNLAGKGVPGEKMLLLPNWADGEVFNAPSESSQARAELGLSPRDFLLLHAGSIGAKQALENVVRAMKHLEEHHEIHLLILGDGSRKQMVQAEAERLGLQRVRFMAPVSSAQHVALLGAADVLVLNQAREVVDVLAPSKLLTYMPSERPVIAAVNAASEAARFVVSSGGGVVVEPENPEVFAQTVLRLQSQPHVREAMGQAGSAYVRLNFRKAELLSKFELVLDDLARTVR